MSTSFGPWTDVAGLRLRVLAKVSAEGQRLGPVYLVSGNKRPVAIEVDIQGKRHLLDLSDLGRLPRTTE